MAGYLLVALLWFGHSKTPLKTVEQLAEIARRSIVRITFPATDNEGNPQTHTCTGFVVDSARGLAVTAAHCITDGENFVDGEPTTVVRMKSDLALIRVPVMSKPPLRVRSDDPVLGEGIVSVGFGYGDLTVLSRGVAGYDSEDGYLYVDGPLIPGMSGGPILDARGEVVGVNQKSNSITGLACPPSEIRAFLKP